MRLFFWRKPRTIKVSARESELIRKAQAEAAGHTLEELDSQDNMPPTALNMSVSKRDGKGFKNFTIPGNGYASSLVDDINQRFADNDLADKRK